MGSTIICRTLHTAPRLITTWIPIEFCTLVIGIGLVLGVAQCEYTIMPTIFCALIFPLSKNHCKTFNRFGSFTESVSARQSQHCNDARDIAFIEKNGVVPKWVCNPILEQLDLFPLI